MARPMKQGLDYFPVDVDFYSDIKVRRVRKDCGPASISVLLCLLCNIYRGGYCIWLKEDIPFVISEITGVTEGAVLEIINKATQVGFFHEGLKEKYGILTSAGIQKRYSSVIKSSKLKRECIPLEHDLLKNLEGENKSSEETKESSEEIKESSEESTQSKAKQSKAKKSIKTSCLDPKESETRKKKKVYSIDCKEMALATLLSTLMLKNKANTLLPKDGLQGWCDTFRLMFERDKRDYAAIESVIKFSQWDEFWRSNIRSAASIREKFDTLEIKMEMVRKQHVGRNQQNTKENATRGTGRGAHRFGNVAGADISEEVR